VSGRKHITITRDYTPTLDACVYALQVLLDQSVMKMAVRPAPEPDSRDASKEHMNVCDATRIIPE
jgi:hypothetical protein